MLYTIEGAHLRVAFVEENGGDGAVVNDLSKGDVAFFPQGLIHYQQNLDCEPATFLAALNSEDPGVVTITTRFFELPTEAVQVMNHDERKNCACSDHTTRQLRLFMFCSMFVDVADITTKRALRLS